MYQFNLNYIWSNWVGPTQLQFIQWIIFLSVGYWSLSSRNDPIFFCSLHWRNLSLYNKITTTHFKQIRFWWKNVIKFRGKVYSNFFKFVQQLFFFECRLNKKPSHTVYYYNIYIYTIDSRMFILKKKIIYISLFNRFFNPHTVYYYAIYSWENNNLIPCWFCTFAHWQRIDQSIILMLGLFEQWKTEKCL